MINSILKKAKNNLSLWNFTLRDCRALFVCLGQAHKEFGIVTIAPGTHS